MQNLVRKALYYNYDYYKGMGTHAFANDDSIVKLHVCEWFSSSLQDAH